jgi:hypothetical protein
LCVATNSLRRWSREDEMPEDFDATTRAVARPKL